MKNIDIGMNTCWVNWSYVVSAFSTIVILQLTSCVYVEKIYIYITLVLQFNTIVNNLGNAVVREKDNRKLFVCLPFSMLLFRLLFFRSKLDFKDKRIRHRAKVVFVAEKVVKGIINIFRTEYVNSNVCSQYHVLLRN